MINLTNYIEDCKILLNKSPLRVLDDVPINIPEEELEHIRRDYEVLESKLYSPLKLVVMGEVKAGKSTLLNSLIGKEVAPTNVLEATASIMEVQYSSVEFGKLIFKKENEIVDTVENIFRILSENNGDMEFFSRLKEVKIGLSLENLKELRIIDTPGLATITNDNQNLTKEYIQNADVILWVINGHYLGQADINEEISMVSEMGKTLICAINRIDEIESDSEELLEYAEDELGIYFEEIFAISAFESLKAVKNNDSRKLNEFGYNKLMNYLINEVERNDEKIQQHSIENSTRALLNKEIHLTNSVSYTLNEIIEAIEKNKKEIDYHSKNIINRINSKYKREIINKFMEEDKLELLEMIDQKVPHRKIKAKEAQILSNDYINEQLNLLVEEIEIDYKEGWQSSIEIIKDKFKENIDLLVITEEMRIVEYNVLNEVSTEVKAKDGAKKGALIAGAWGASFAGYAAWLGPYAASVTIGTAVASMVPPILIAGAITGAVAKIVTSKNGKKEIRKSIEANFSIVRLKIGTVFIENTNEIMMRQNELVKENLQQATIDGFIKGYDEERVRKLVKQLKMYTEDLNRQLLISNI